MLEFLIRRTDGEWFDNAWSSCNPKSVPYELIPGWGNHRERLGYPKIGAGLAGGDWPRIAAIIDRELAGEDHTLVEFGAEQKR